jgi:hypothetical protein
MKIGGDISEELFDSERWCIVVFMQGIVLGWSCHGCHLFLVVLNIKIKHRCDLETLIPLVTLLTYN